MERLEYEGFSLAGDTYREKETTYLGVSLCGKELRVSCYLGNAAFVKNHDQSGREIAFSFVERG